MGIVTSRPFKLAVLCVALAGAAFVLLFSAPAPAHDKPKVQWTPASVNETIQPGQTKTIPVVLTPDKNLPDTFVYVSPGIASFVSVSPTSIGKTRKGTNVSLTLTVSVPIDALPATTTGIIELQKAKQQARDDEEDGQEQAGKGEQEKKIGISLPMSLNVVWPQISVTDSITLTYPGSLVSLLQPDPKYVVLARVADAPYENHVDGIPVIASRVDRNPGGLTLGEYYDGDPAASLGPVIETLLVDGLTGYLFVPDETESGHASVIVPLPNGDFLHVTDVGLAFQQDGTFDRVLNGFHIGR